MCMLEAWNDDVPWGESTNLRDVVEAVGAGMIPPRPESMSDRGWQLIQKMTHASPSHRLTLAQVFDEVPELINSEIWVCSNCELAVSASDNYCGFCGVKIIPSKQRTAIDLMSLPANIKQARARVFGSDGALNSRLIRLEGRNSC